MGVVTVSCRDFRGGSEKLMVKVWSVPLYTMPDTATGVAVPLTNADAVVPATKYASTVPYSA